MTSDMTGIIFLTANYFFLKTSSYSEYESKNFRITKLEKKVRKAIIKFSKDEPLLINDYLPEEKNEIISWIKKAITECNKRRKREQS